MLLIIDYVISNESVFVLEDKTIPNTLSLKATFKFYKHDTC